MRIVEKRVGRVGRAPRVQEWDGTLLALQSIVGGNLIEVLTLDRWASVLAREWDDPQGHADAAANIELGRTGPILGTIVAMCIDASGENAEPTVYRCCSTFSRKHASAVGVGVVGARVRVQRSRWSVRRVVTIASTAAWSPAGSGSTGAVALSSSLVAVAASR